MLIASAFVVADCGPRIRSTCTPTAWSGGVSCGAQAPLLRFAEQTVVSSVTQFQSGHGFTVSGTPGSSNLNDTSTFVLGTQSASVTTNGAGASATIGRAAMGTYDFTDKMPKIWVRVDSVTKGSNLNFTMGDTGFANRYAWRFDTTQAQKFTTEGDWVGFTLSWGQVLTTGTPNRAAITDFRFSATDDSTGAVTLHVNGIGMVEEPVSKYPNGVVSITFDDGFLSQHTEALRVMAPYAFKGTAYIIIDKIGNYTNFMTLAQVQALQSSGWQISAHSYTTGGHDTAFPNLTSQTALESEIIQTRDWLLRNGFNGYDHFAYPQGEITGGTLNVVSTVGTYFSSARSIYERSRETYPPADARKLRVLYVQNTDTLASIQTEVTTAKANREWLILVFHNLTSSPSVTVDWAISDFEALMATIYGAGIPVKTIDEVLRN